MIEPGESPDTDFGEGLRRIRKVIDFFQPLDEKKAIERTMALLHPDVQVFGAPGLGPARGYDGRDAFLAYFAEVSEHGAWIEIDASEIRIEPSGAILVTATLQMTRPDGSDTTPAWFVIAFRDGLISSLQTHLDQQLAEEALGAADL